MSIVLILLCLLGGVLGILNCQLWLIPICIAPYLFTALSPYFKQAKVLPFYGVANIITALRWCLVVCAASLSWDTQYQLVKILVLAVPLLDICDGLIARKRGETTHFGSLLDMETDAMYVYVVSLGIYIKDTSMWIVLLPAFLRYIYKLIIDVLDSGHHFIEKSQRYASVIAGNYFVALILYVYFPAYTTQLYLTLGSVLILFSFGLSFKDFLLWKAKK